MSTPLRPRTIEDWFRLGAYLIGASWALAFLAYVPTSYATVVSHVFVVIWSLLVGGGMLVAAIGAMTRRDTKVELSGLYLALSGMVFYLVAQAAFLGPTTFRDRIAFTVFILFHVSLMLPRIAGLEWYRRAVHRQRQGGGKTGS